MKVKIVNDTPDIADRRVETIKEIKGIETYKVIVDPSKSSSEIIDEVCRQIESENIVVLDVNLGGDSLRWMGLEIFFKLFESGERDLWIIFDSGEPCKAELAKRWEDRNFPLDLGELEKKNKIIFAYEKLNRNIVKAVRKALGFSFQDACSKILNPFLFLHTAVQHIQFSENPNPQIFAEIDGKDPYEYIDWDLEDAHGYIDDLKPYAARFELERFLDQIESFLDGSLKTLCKVLTDEKDPQKRLKKIQPLVLEGGECASFIDEFKCAVDALREIDKGGSE